MCCKPSVLQGLGSAPLQAEGLHLGHRVGGPLANTDSGAGLGAEKAQSCSRKVLTVSQRTPECQDREEMRLREWKDHGGGGRDEGGALPDPQRDGTKGKLLPFTLGVAMHRVTEESSCRKNKGTEGQSGPHA